MVKAKERKSSELSKISCTASLGLRKILFFFFPPLECRARVPEYLYLHKSARLIRGYFTIRHVSDRIRVGAGIKMSGEYT